MPRRLAYLAVAATLLALAIAGCRLLNQPRSEPASESPRSLPQPSLFLPTKPSPTMEVPPPRD